ncbi:MAG: SusC/RagA family TonB-linked outer membrane protein [Bacteroidales bacterium]|nr:SusC/RagA family TonB-linked outer membrane protein [Bacteroidales bacterium]
MKMTKKLSMMLLMVLMTIAAYAQGSVLTGTVYEIFDGRQEPCMGVNVAVVNAQNRLVTGVTTDINGQYAIRMPAGENFTLLYSFIGLVPQRIAYTGQKTQDVVMKEDAKALGEVVIAQERTHRSELGVSERAFTGSSQRISMDEVMESLPVNSVEEALQGQLAGVDILTSGDPGAKGSIRIRGTATLNSNADPLIIINGVPYNTDIDDDFNFATASTEDFADMLALNPNDIENIEVLKDAASTAIYGTKGANGVLLITTKRGAKGKPQFVFSHKSTLKMEPESIPMLTGDEYTAFMQDAIWNTANARGLDASGDLLNMLFSEKSYAIGYQPDWSYFDEYNTNTDWLGEIRKNAYSTDNNFSMSGGGDRATYRFSLGWTMEDGTTRNNDMQRLTSSLRIGYNFSDRMNVNAEFTYSDTNNDQTYLSTSSLRSEAQRKMPNKYPYYINDETKTPTDIYFTYQDENEFQGAFDGSKNFHPIAMVDESFNNTNTKEEKITISPTYTILWNENQQPILRYQGYVSMKFKTVKSRKFLPQEATGVNIENENSNYSYDGYTNNFSLQSETKLLYNQSFADDQHQLVGAAIWRTTQSQGSTYATNVYGVAANGMGDPVTGGTITSGSLNSGTSDARTLSGIANMNYTMFRWITLNGTWNYEGNSALSQDNRWALFQSYGGALNLQDFEPIQLWTSEWLSQAKLRVSWGQSGKAPSGTSPYVGTYTALTDKYGTLTPVVPNNMQLNKLKWETSEEWNYGLDLGLWQDRIKMTFDYYRKTTTDLLQKSVKVASTSAFSSIAYTNSGSLRNEGWEYRIDWRIHESKDWRWNMDFNINRNVNTILEVPDNIAMETYSFKNGQYAQKILAGTPVGSFFGYRYLGVYQNLEDTYAKDDEGRVMRDLLGNPVVMKNGTYTCYPGDAMYEDINYDGTIDENDIVYIGNCNPVVTGGAGLTARYKKMSMTMRFHYRLGQKIINQARMNNEAMYNTDNQSKAVLRRWRSEGDDTDIPRALYNYGLNYLGSDRFVEDCSYIRLQTVSFNYALPKSFAEKIKASSASMFLTCYDLLTLTNYKGQDPEVTLPTSVTALAKDNSSTPRSHRYAVGLTVKF